MKLGDKIKKMRISLSLNQVDLAQYLGIAQCTLSVYENNIKIPSYKILKKLDKFSKDNDYILDIF